MSFSLRPARPEDREAVLRLSEGLADLFEPPRWRSRREIAEGDKPGLNLWFDLRPPASETDLWIAESGDRVVGCEWAVRQRDFFTGETVAYLEVIVVAPELRGAGVGRALMERFLHWAHEIGAVRATLNAFAANTDARRLYENFGFEVEFVRYALPLE